MEYLGGGSALDLVRDAICEHVQCLSVDLSTGCVHCVLCVAASRAL